LRKGHKNEFELKPQIMTKYKKKRRGSKTHKSKEYKNKYMHENIHIPALLSSS